MADGPELVEDDGFLPGPAPSPSLFDVALARRRLEADRLVWEGIRNAWLEPDLAPDSGGSSD